MKKILVVLMLMFLGVPAFSYEIDLTKEGKIQEKINQIGFRLLNANRIEKRTIFEFNSRKAVNAVTVSGLGYGRKVVVYRGIIPYLDNEDEIAAILAHEISHIVDSYDGILRGSFSGLGYAFAPKKYELKADKRAVDYMVKAGYNPVGLIIALNKMSAQYRFDMLSTHPLTSKRLVTIYEYIYKKYPTFLANNKYQNNIYYQNFLLTSIANRKLLENSIQKNSKKSPAYK